MDLNDNNDGDLLGDNLRFSLCIDNFFSEISVPAGCEVPVAVITIVSPRGDERPPGEEQLPVAVRTLVSGEDDKPGEEQTLFCKT